MGDNYYTIHSLDQVLNQAWHNAWHVQAILQGDHLWSGGLSMAAILGPGDGLWLPNLVQGQLCRTISGMTGTVQLCVKLYICIWHCYYSVILYHCTINNEYTRYNIYSACIVFRYWKVKLLLQQLIATAIFKLNCSCYKCLSK